MDIIDVFNSGDVNWVRAENGDGRELYVQKVKDGIYQFEWSLDIEPYDHEEEVGNLDSPSAVIPRDNYDTAKVAGYIGRNTELSRKKVFWKLHEMRDLLEPNRDPTTLQ